MMVSHLADRTPPANLRSLLPFLQGSCFVLIETARFAATSLLIVNLVVGFVLHSWERVAGYVMFIAAAAVQLAFAAAVAIAIQGATGRNSGTALRDTAPCAAHVPTRTRPWPTRAPLLPPRRRRGLGCSRTRAR